MTAGADYLKEQARNAAELRLRKAATFLSLNVKTPIFQKRMGKGATSVLVRLEWPGVVKVIDPDTGEILAVSVSSNPSLLRSDFVPTVPALAGKSHGGA